MKSGGRRALKSTVKAARNMVGGKKTAFASSGEDGMQTQWICFPVKSQNVGELFKWSPSGVTLKLIPVSCYKRACSDTQHSVHAYGS